MKEDFVTYEQAVKLKELGFDWKCNHWYHPLEPEKIIECQTYCNHNSFERPYSAPTLAQVAKWLRDVKGLIIYSEPRFYKGKKPLLGYEYHLFNKKDGYYSHIESETIYDTYEEALSEGINEALELIKEKK